MALGTSEPESKVRGVLWKERYPSSGQSDLTPANWLQKSLQQPSAMCLTPYPTILPFLKLFSRKRVTLFRGLSQHLRPFSPAPCKTEETCRPSASGPYFLTSPSAAMKGDLDPMSLPLSLCRQARAYIHTCVSRNTRAHSAACRGPTGSRQRQGQRHVAKAGTAPLRKWLGADRIQDILLTKILERERTQRERGWGSIEQEAALSKRPGYRRRGRRGHGTVSGSP